MYSRTVVPTQYGMPGPPSRMYGPPPGTYGQPPGTYGQPPGTYGPPMYSQSYGAMYRPLGPTPTRTVCPSCHFTVMSRIEHEPTAKTHLLALIICLVCFPCSCIPYFINSCRATNHYCTNCGAYMGAYEAF